MTDGESRHSSKPNSLHEYRRAVADLLRELAEVGFPVESVGELSRYKPDYRRAVPVLLKHLPSIDDPYAKMAVIHALAVKEAKPAAAPALLEEFRRAKTVNARWSIGDALAVVADDSVFDEIAGLARSKGYGKAREMVVVSLGNLRNPRAVDALLSLLDDSEVQGHAIIALGKLKATRAKTRIEPFLNHPKAWIRRVAKAALLKIEKGEQKAREKRATTK